MRVLSLLSLLLYSCAAPESEWPGLVLLDRSALDAGTTWREAGSPLRVGADSALLVGGLPETLEPADGELWWVTMPWGAQAGDAPDIDVLEVGEEIDGDAVELFVDGDISGGLAALDLGGAADLSLLDATVTASGSWLVTGQGALLELAQVESSVIADALPVLAEDVDAALTVEGHASVPSTLGSLLAGGASVRGGSARTAHGSADGRAEGGTSVDGEEAGDPSGDGSLAGDDTPTALARADSAALVGLHESGGKLLLLAADGSWRNGLDDDASGGSWWVDHDGHLNLHHGCDVFVLPVERLDAGRVLIDSPPF